MIVFIFLVVIRHLPQHPSHMQRNFFLGGTRLYAVQKFIESSSLPGPEVGNNVVCLSLQISHVLSGLEEVAGDAHGRGGDRAGGWAAHGAGGGWRQVLGLRVRMRPTEPGV